jgi:hypothetical protein
MDESIFIDTEADYGRNAIVMHEVPSGNSTILVSTTPSLSTVPSSTELSSSSPDETHIGSSTDCVSAVACVATTMCLFVTVIVAYPAGSLVVVFGASERVD